MPRNNITKDIVKSEILKIKYTVDNDFSDDEKSKKDLIQKYLNQLLYKIEEYRY